METSAHLSRRGFLGTLVAAGFVLPFAETALAQSAVAPPAVPVRAGAVPNPLDESIYEGDVGNLLGPVERIRDAYGWAVDSFASDKFALADHGQWRLRANETILQALSYRPDRTDFNATVVEKVDRGTHTREKVYFNTTPELRVGAYLLVPKNLSGKAPAIVALHDHGAFYRWGKEKLVSVDGEHPALTQFKHYYAGRSIADDLAAQGYVVIVIDMFYWGERRMRMSSDPRTGPDESAQDVQVYNRARQADEPLLARTIESAGFTWPGVIFWDDMRTVDYLISRPEVDASRIGCVGLSVGGFRVNHLMALDERVKAGVAVCWLTSYQHIQPKHVVHTTGFTMLVPGLYRRLDMPDVVSLAAPRALLNINGLKDGLFPVETGIKPAYRTLETVYTKLGAADRFKGSLYDAPHEFNAQMQQEAWAWLKKWV